MHIKNSILLLTQISTYFPIQYATGVRLEQSVAALIQTETREDLKILAQGYVTGHFSVLVFSHPLTSQSDVVRRYSYKAILSKRKKHWRGQPPKPDSVCDHSCHYYSEPATNYVVL